MYLCTEHKVCVCVCVCVCAYMQVYVIRFKGSSTAVIIYVETGQCIGILWLLSDTVCTVICIFHTEYIEAHVKKCWHIGQSGFVLTLNVSCVSFVSLFLSIQCSVPYKPPL
jgi:hypothetical protein